MICSRFADLWRRGRLRAGAERRAWLAAVCCPLWAIAPLAGQETPPASRPPQPPAAAQDLDQQLLEGLPGSRSGPAAPAGEAAPQTSPLLAIAARMEDAGQRLQARDAAQTTQQLQAAILDDLDRLIEQAQQQAQDQTGENPAAASDQQAGADDPGASPQGAGGQQPSPDAEQQPGGAGTTGEQGVAGNQAGQGVGAASDQAAVEPRGSESLQQSAWWGSLPPQMRQQLRRSQSEQFLPAYEKLIESYYRRLAEDW